MEKSKAFPVKKSKQKMPECAICHRRHTRDGGIQSAKRLVSPVAAGSDRVDLLDTPNIKPCNTSSGFGFQIVGVGSSFKS